MKTCDRGLENAGRGRWPEVTVFQHKIFSFFFPAVISIGLQMVLFTQVCH